MTLRVEWPVLDCTAEKDVPASTTWAATRLEPWFDLRRRGAAGRGKFIYIDAIDGPDAPIRVHFAVPACLHAKAPIVFVLPGIERDGMPYLGTWAPHAARAGAILLIPELPQKTYPRARGYNLGNMFDRNGHPIARPRWAFSLIERLFDHVRAETGNRRDGYVIYGHSAGGQLVQRMLLFYPEARIEHAVVANSGWYTLPSFAEDYPYGLRGTGIGEDALRGALERPMSILVGGKDIDAAHSTLRRTRGAMRQGKNRVERARTFVAAGQDAALAQCAGLAWRIALVPGAGHDQGNMAAEAVEHLFPAPAAGTGRVIRRPVNHRLPTAAGHNPETAGNKKVAMRNFVRVKDDVDIRPLLDEIERQPEAWTKFTGRQDKYRAQAETLSIPIRGAVKSGAEGRKNRDIHKSRFTTISQDFPHVVEFMKMFAAERNAKLGRARLVTLPPGHKVHPHIDRGKYYKKRDRYHLVLRSETGSWLKSGDEEVRMQTGELWWFDNKQVHEARNDSEEDRIHFIFDLMPRDRIEAETGDAATASDGQSSGGQILNCDQDAVDVGKGLES